MATLVGDTESGYIDSLARVRELAERNPEAAHQGTITLSHECHSTDVTLATGLEHDPALVFRLLRLLPKLDRDLLLSYWILRKSQGILGPLFHLEQNLCGEYLHAAAARLGAFQLLGPEPSREVIAALLAKAGIAAEVADAIVEYRHCRSFHLTSSRLEKPLPWTRRTLRETTKTLISHSENHVVALGHYLSSLMAGITMVGTGLSSAEQSRRAHVYRKDPDTLGHFRIDVTDPGLDELFTPRAVVALMN